MFWLYFLGCIILGVIAGYLEVHRAKRKERREIEIKLNEKDALLSEIQNLETQYGKSDIFISTSDDYKLASQVISFSSSDKIYITGNFYNMKDIINFEVVNNSFLQQGAKEYQSSTNLGSAVGRAIVGGVLTGGVGAIIGGTTGSRTISESKLEDDKIVQDYSVMVSLNSFKTPSILINVKNDKVLADLCGLFRTILIKNKNNTKEQ